MQNDYTALLTQYRNLWTNRMLEGDDSESILLSTIERDLNDELTHPRVRKQPLEKFYIAIKRINESDLVAEDKSALIKFHINILEKIQNG